MLFYSHNLCYNNFAGVNDILKKLARINDIKGLPSRFEVRTARTMALTQIENEIKMKLGNRRILEDEIEKEKEKSRSKDRHSNYLNFKPPSKTEITISNAPNNNSNNNNNNNNNSITIIEDPVPDSIKKSLCSNLKCLTSRVKVMFSLTDGTALHALTLLIRYECIFIFRQFVSFFFTTLYIYSFSEDTFFFTVSFPNYFYLHLMFLQIFTKD